MAAAKKNPFRSTKDSSEGATGGVPFTLAGADIDPPVICGGIEVDNACTLVLVLEHDGDTVKLPDGSEATWGTAGGCPYVFDAKQYKPYKVKKIIAAGSTNGATGRFLL